MNVQVLSLGQAWTSGRKLWVTGLPEHSKTARQLDWSLHFQISKGRQAKFPERPEGLRKILEKIEWDFPEAWTEGSSDLLIAAEPWLPCSWVLVLTQLHTRCIEVPLRSLAKHWAELQNPPLRLFLPGDLNSEALREMWSHQDLPTEFDLVVE